MFNLGYAQLGTGAMKEAISNLARAAEIRADDPRIRYLLAVAHDEVGDSDKAEQDLARVIQLDPHHHDALTFCAHLQMAKGRIGEARKTLERLVEAHPRSADALWLRAQLEMLNFDAAKALEYLRRAEALAADDVDILIAIGQANLMLQRPTAARRAAARAIALDPEEPTARMILGWAYLFENDLSQAERSFGETLRLDPQQADAEAGLALIALGGNDLPRTREALQRAKRIDPANPAVLLTEGALANKQGNPELARRVLEELMSMNSLGQAGWTNRGLMERNAQSATLRRVTGKWMRYVRRRQRAERLASLKGARR